MGETSLPTQKPLPVRAFLEHVQKWIDAIDSCDREGASFQSKQVQQIGLLLAYDPEFRHVFQRNIDMCVEEAPVHVLNCVYAFFEAVADAGCSGDYRPVKATAR